MTEFVLGIDWGSKCHAVCVDAHGEVVLEEEVAHRGADVLAFVERLFDVVGGDAARVSAAMEAPHGVMVEVLLERGVDCYSINPKQLDRFRDRHSVAGAKDDRLDALVLASSLQTDQALFRAISLPDAQRLRTGRTQSQLREPDGSGSCGFERDSCATSRSSPSSVDGMRSLGCGRSSSERPRHRRPEACHRPG
ncbi:MAG: transposase [Deltaproteobacteria bacterium]